MTLPRPTGVSAESLPPNACRFAYRCTLRTHLDNPPRCMEEQPELAGVGSAHASACHFAGDIADFVNRVKRDDTPGA
jgi:hypothetical protein